MVTKSEIKIETQWNMFFRTPCDNLSKHTRSCVIYSYINRLWDDISINRNTLNNQITNNLKIALKIILLIVTKLHKIKATCILFVYTRFLLIYFSFNFIGFFVIKAMYKNYIYKVNIKIFLLSVSFISILDFYWLKPIHIT